MSVLVILCAINFRKRIRLTQPLLLYIILLIVSFWLLTKSDTDIYFLLFLPWLAVLAASWLAIYLPNHPVWQRRTGRVLLVLYGIVAIIQLYEVFSENRELPDTDVHNALLASHMPNRHTNVIAPLDFFFGQIDNYTIRGLTYYYFLEQAGKSMPLATFFQLANNSKVEYIISDHRQNASYEIPINAPTQIDVYHRVFQDKWNPVYARQRSEMP